MKYADYRQQRSCGKVMFLQASVILLTGGGGGYLTPTPPKQTPPGADTPPPEQTPPGAETYPPPEQTHTPLEQIPPEQTPPRADTTPPEHAVRYGQRAGGTHPTGMQSCFALFFCKSGM